MNDSFFQDEIRVVDRSTLERAATCPHQLALMLQGYGKNAGNAAASGSEVHDALSRTIGYYVESGGNMDLNDLRRILENELMSARPDVLADARVGFRATFFQWTKYLSEINPAAILMYDGGTGDKASQLAKDIEVGRETIRVTSELDLCLSTSSPEVVDEVDYKTGWATWTIEEIRKSFQFQLHAALLFEHFPDVRQVRIAVWNTRAGGLTPKVAFERSDLKQIHTLIRSAVGLWWQTVETQKGEAWPTTEKCRICPVATHCEFADREVKEFNADACVNQLVALNAKATAMRKQLDAHVDKHGDILTAAGNAYGRNKPRRERKRKCELYGAEADESDE